MGGVPFGRRIGVPDGWQMPQGGIDQGETPEAAALRELHEETGLRDAPIVATHPDWVNYDLPAWAIGRRWRNRWIGQTQKWFLMRHDGPDSAIDLEHHEVEFEEWRWASVAETLDRIVDFKRGVYEKVVAELGPAAERIIAEKD